MRLDNKLAIKRILKSLAGHILGGAISGAIAYLTANPYWFILEPVIQTAVNGIAKKLRTKYSIETIF